MQTTRQVYNSKRSPGFRSIDKFHSFSAINEVAYIVFQTVKILTTHTCKNLFSCICVHVDVTGNTLSNERQKLKSKGAKPLVSLDHMFFFFLFFF